MSLVITDLKEALAFYVDVFGLKPLPRPPFDFEGAWLDSGNDQAIHLIVNASGQTLRHQPTIDGRDGHFALRVDRYTRVKSFLEGKGIPHRGNPDSVTGRAQIFCCDPDGNVIELNCDSVD